MNSTLIGIDLAKSTFALEGRDKWNNITWAKRLSRAKLPAFLAQLPCTTIGMEACAGANYWGRKCQEFGHKVVVIPAAYVKPYRVGGKNDANDAGAICEAARNPSIHSVPVKTIEQQDLQTMMNSRLRQQHNLVAVLNQTRSILAEYGVVAPRGPARLKEMLNKVLHEPLPGFSEWLLEELQRLREEIAETEKRLLVYEKKLTQFSRKHPKAKQLIEVPGIGPVIATALLALVANPQGFRNGRAFSAWLGLVPRQNTTGGKPKLLGINKRGNQYLRSLFVNAAHSVMQAAQRYQKDDRISLWALDLNKKKGSQRAAVALANKLARLAWVVLARDAKFVTDQEVLLAA